jgi:hypothetical protein
VFLYSCQSNDKNLNPKMAVQLAMDMQELRRDNGDVVQEQDLRQQTVGRRRPILIIVDNHKSNQKKQMVPSLDVAFQRRMTEERVVGKDMIHCMAV